MTFTQMTESNGNRTHHTEVTARTTADGENDCNRVVADKNPGPAFAAQLDGGWGWVVTFASFSICVLVDGVCFSMGIFFDAFRNEFNSTKAATSWIGSVLNGSYMIVGPIVSALVNIYGCRRVAIVGAMLSSIAFFCSTFTQSIGMLILTFGLLGGIGFGFMYLPAIIIVGYYFERRRALATGIACCGSGIGGFLFAPFIEYLLETYGWRGSVWIISALVLNGVLFALFYRPLPGMDVENVYASDADSQSCLQSESLGLRAEESLTPTPSVSLRERIDSIELLHSKHDQKEEKKRNNLDLLKPSTGIYKTSSAIVSGAGKLSDEDCSFRTGVGQISQSHNNLFTGAANEEVVKKHKAKETKRLDVPYLQRKDVFYNASLWHLKEYQELGSLEEFRRQMTSTDQNVDHPSSVTSGDDVTRSHDVHVTSSKPSMKNALSGIFDFHLLKSPTFLVYGLACFLCMAGFFVPFIYMPNYVKDLGEDSRQGALLISIIGITNTVGRVAIGFISDQPWADSLQINNVALMLGGAVTLIVPYLTDYFALAIYSGIFGSCIAVFVSLRSIIMVELMGLEKLTTSFGFVIMFQGLSSLVGSPIAGALSDHTGNYDAAFYMAGITLFLSGVICIPLRRIAHWEEAKMATEAVAYRKAWKPTERCYDDPEKQPSTFGDNNGHVIMKTNNNNNDNRDMNGNKRKRDGLLTEETIPMIEA